MFGRFKIDLREERQVIQQCRHGRGESDLAVRYVQEFRDEKRRGAHYGRHDLAAVRCHRFDGRRHVGRVTGALHQRYGDGSVYGDVGDGAA
jgi:hypothetical protein